MRHSGLEKKAQNRPLYSKYKNSKIEEKKLVYRNYECKILFFSLNYDGMMANDQIVKVLRKKI